MAISDPGGRQRNRERVATEMGMAARPRHGPDVRELVNPMRREQRDELVERSRGVTDGVDRHRTANVCVWPAAVQVTDAAAAPVAAAAFAAAATKSAFTDAGSTSPRLPR